MSQQQIANILKKYYPKYLSPKEIIELTGLTKSSVFNNLKRLKKRNEVEINMDWSSKFAQTWKKSYRIKPIEVNK